MNARCEVAAMTTRPRPQMPFRYDGELCSLAMLKMRLCDAALIGWDVAVRMDDTTVTIYSGTRAVRFTRALGADGVWDVAEEWVEL